MHPFPSHLPDEAVLEGLLQRACEDVAWRPAFYRQLLKSKVIVILPDDDVVKTLPRRDRIRFVQWKRIDGTAAIPLFSSARTFQEAVPQGAKCLVLDLRLVLSVTRGALLHLNPYSEFNVELSPDEIDTLLLQGYPVVPEGFETPTDRLLSFKRVVDPPSALLNALTALYSQHPQVRGAYLACVIGLHDDARESLLLGLDIDGEPEPVVHDSALIIRETYSGPLDFDIVHIGMSGHGPTELGFEPASRFFDQQLALSGSTARSSTRQL